MARVEKQMTMTRGSIEPFRDVSRGETHGRQSLCWGELVFAGDQVGLWNVCG